MTMYECPNPKHEDYMNGHDHILLYSDDTDEILQYNDPHIIVAAFFILCQGGEVERILE